MSYWIRLHANRPEASVVSGKGKIGEAAEGLLGGWGRFYSALRPELDLRLSACMADAELAGQSHPVSLSMPSHLYDIPVHPSTFSLPPSSMCSGDDHTLVPGFSLALYGPTAFPRDHTCFSDLAT